MDTLAVTLTGTTPLLMHNGALVDKFHPINVAKASITSKRKRTDADEREIRWLDWEGSLYLDDAGQLVIPGILVEAAIREGAKPNKLGKQVQRAVQVKEFLLPLVFPDAGMSLSDLYTKQSALGIPLYVSTLRVGIGRSAIARVRARFNVWSINPTIEFDPKEIDRASVLAALQYQGRFGGLGDYRPRFGKFQVAVRELPQEAPALHQELTALVTTK